MAMKKLPPFGNGKKGLKADSARKTKEAQSMNMAAVKGKKAVAVESKRKTAEGIKAATKKKLDNKRKTGFYEKP